MAGCFLFCVWSDYLEEQGVCLALVRYSKQETNKQTKSIGVFYWSVKKPNPTTIDGVALNRGVTTDFCWTGLWVFLISG